MGTWLNGDNLYLKFGRDEGHSNDPAGSYCYGENGSQVLEITLDLAELTQTETIANDVAVLPDNALIESVEVLTLVAAATGTAIDVGLCHISRDTSDSEFTADPNGLLAAFAAATMSVVGERVTFYGPTSANTEESLPASITTGGDMIGDVTTAPCLITASMTDATAFTAGRVKIRIKYLPNALTGTGAA